MYKRILLPYDFGNSFEKVPEQLQKLTDNQKDAEVVVFNIITEGELSNYVRYQGKHLEDAVAEKENDLIPFKEKLEEIGINYSTKFKSGNITHELLKEIRENDYDIVVMSNKRSKRDIKHVLGHVTHKIAKRVNTPVLIIK
ncbi:universal stress protein [Corticicoccus populi]|uniref:Universal stress protein n=1 Tax=Corticicoccus populi TaxID=1812821 RepID=A0ABW5WTY0_9STAP